MEKQYKAVFFDLGGTLRIAFLEEAYMRHARRKMAEIAGTDMPYEEFYQMIEERYEPYRKWALGEFKESGDEELWPKFLHLSLSVFSLIIVLASALTVEIGRAHV